MPKIAVLCIVLLGVVAQRHTTCPFRQSHGWLNGYEALCLGMTYEELLALRTNIAIDPDHVSSDDSFSASELVTSHPGSSAKNLLVLYQIRNRRLTSANFLWQLEQPGVLASRRVDFLRFLRDALGGSFEASVTALNPGAAFEKKVPLLVWCTTEFKAAAYFVDLDTGGATRELVAMVMLEESGLKISTIDAIQTKGFDGDTLRDLFRKQGMPINAAELRKIVDGQPDDQRHHGEPR